MPIFNITNLATESPPSNQGVFFDITDPEFLATIQGSEWVSAETALRNSDLFSIINQLSNDLATVKLTANYRESLITRQTMLTALISINLSLLKCYLVGKPLLIDGEMKMGGI